MRIYLYCAFALAALAALGAISWAIVGQRDEPKGAAQEVSNEHQRDAFETNAGRKGGKGKSRPPEGKHVEPSTGSLRLEREAQLEAIEDFFQRVVGEMIAIGSVGPGESSSRASVEIPRCIELSVLVRRCGEFLEEFHEHGPSALSRRNELLRELIGANPQVVLDSEVEALLCVVANSMLMNGFEEALRIAADSRLQVIEKTPDAQVYHALMNAIVAGEEWRPLRKESPQSEIEAFLAPDYPRQELARFRVQASFLGVIARAGLAHYAEVVERLMQQTSNAGVRRAAYACLLRLGASADGSLEAEKDFLSEVAHLPKGRVSNEDIARIRDLYANASDVKPLIPHALYVLEEQRHSTMGAVAYAFSEALLSRPDLRTFRDDVLSNLLKSSSRSAWALLSMVLAKAFAMTDDVRITGFVEAELASPAADERYNEYTNQVYYGHLVSLYDEVVIDKRRVVYLTKVFRNSVDPLHRNIHDRVYPLYLANGLVDKKYKQEDEFWAREVAELTAWAADRPKFLETQRARLVLAWSALKKEGALHALEFQLTQPGNSREAIVLLGEVRESIASGQGWR